MLFSGDSVLEFLRSTVIGRPWSMIADCAEAFATLATRYNAHILAISGRHCPPTSLPTFRCLTVVLHQNALGRRTHYLPAHLTLRCGQTLDRHAEYAGDYTSNLLWRITKGGEMPMRAPKAVVIYIGSNDLSAADCGGNETELLAAVKPIVNR